MNITILCIGKLKESWWRDAVSEYAKRLRPFCTLNIVECKEARLHGDGEAAQKQVKVQEGDFILQALSRLEPSPYVIALDLKGGSLSSEGFSAELQSLADSGRGDIAFVIGGSLGLSQAVLSRADTGLSFSKFTFPHQLMRVILLEQVYRAFKIWRHEPYHK